jgi:hypothetical protein
MKFSAAVSAAQAAYPARAAHLWFQARLRITVLAALI